VAPSAAGPDTLGPDELAGGPETTAVEDDVADAEPDPLPPVTTTSTVEPTAELPSTYVDDVAPEIGEQFAPPESQRCHW
jgi:hypothetical protein